MKKILFIYHSNVCNKSCGSNSYLYNILSLLYKFGFKIDVFVPQSFDNDWDISNCEFIENIYLDKKNRSDKPKKEENFREYSIRRIKKMYNRFFGSITFLESKDKLDWIGDDEITRFKYVLGEDNYDYILFSYIYYSKLLEFVPENIRTICSVSDFLSIQQMQAGKHKFSEVIEEEIAAMNKFNEAIFISSDEMSFFSNFNKKTKFSYLPHFLIERTNKEKEKDIDMLFLGSDNEHNIIGINWFLENVYPFIITKNYNFVIAGRITKKIKRKKYPKVRFIDYIEDVGLVYDSTKIAISPLKSGTGIKIKIVEALSNGIPVVCSSRSLVGFMEKENNGCIVVDDPKDFADAIEKLLENEELRIKLSIQGKEQFKKYFSYDRAENILSKIFK